MKRIKQKVTVQDVLKRLVERVGQPSDISTTSRNRNVTILIHTPRKNKSDPGITVRRFTGIYRNSLGTCRVDTQIGTENSFFHWENGGELPSSKIDSIRIERTVNGLNAIIIEASPHND